MSQNNENKTSSLDVDTSSTDAQNNKKLAQEKEYCLIMKIIGVTVVTVGIISMSCSNTNFINTFLILLGSFIFFALGMEHK